jgi:hypothetical protein
MHVPVDQPGVFGYGRRPRVPKEGFPMFLMLSKKPRRANRGKTNRYRAKLKAKNRSRRNRVYQRG